MQRTDLKLAIVAKEKRYWRLAAETNQLLPSHHHLSEQHISQIVTCRKDPSLEQTRALAAVLGCSSVSELFPELGNGGLE